MDHRPQGILPELPTLTCGQGFDLLSDVTVLDLTTSIAGPYGTMQLADWGARVIKVERPGTGDDTRHWGPPFLEDESLWFLSVNRNKQSVTLDYSGARGYAVLLALLRKVDVVVTNQVPRVQTKLKTDLCLFVGGETRPDLCCAHRLRPERGA